MTSKEKARYEELSAKDCLIDDEDIIDYYSLRCKILEEENQELKFQLECKSKGNEIIIKQMDLFMKQRDKLYDENQELKMQKNSTMLLMKLMSLDENIVESALILDKYRKAIEILAKHIIIHKDIDDETNDTIYYFEEIYTENLNEKKYELLKDIFSEVLGE